MHVSVVRKDLGYNRPSNPQLNILCIIEDIYQFIYMALGQCNDNKFPIG